MLQNSRSHKAFVCLTDTSEDSTTRKSGGWFKRRVFTVFILCRYNTRSQDDYREKLGELIGEEFSGLFDNLIERERG